MKIRTQAMPISEVTEEQAKQFIKWVWEARTINCFDPDVVSYPRSCMLYGER
jgi:hypothetical protein